MIFISTFCILLLPTRTLAPKLPRLVNYYGLKIKIGSRILVRQMPSSMASPTLSRQSMQTLLFLSNKVDELCGQVKTLRAEKNALQAEKTRFTSNKLEVDKLLAELRVQLSARDSDVSHLQTEVESLNALVAGEEERLYMAAMEAEIKLKAKMMEDYQNGYAETWNAEKIFAARDELERITASDAIPTEKLGDILVDMISEDRAQDEQQVGGAEKN